MALLAFASRANAEEPDACALVTRANVARCVVQASAAVRVEREAGAAASGRRTAASPWFPSNPTLALSLARRAGDGRGDALNYSASLSQELELAGQRASRRRAAEAEVDAHQHQAVAVARRAAAGGYAAYFELLAARESVAVAARLEATAEQVARVTRGRAEGGVASTLDADVADAALLRARQARLDAERELVLASARLSVLLGRDPARGTVPVTGALEPIAGVDAIARPAAANQPQLRALASDQRAWEARAEERRRARVPNLTVQAFAQNDGFNEQVLGAGVSFPIPLPEPAGRLHAGDIAEAEAMARETAARSEVLRRELQADLAIASASYASRRAEAALFEADRSERTARMLAEIAKEIEAGRLSVRDAVVAEQQLIDVLRGAVDARRALCLASVELALAAGVPLEGAPR